MPGPGRFWPAHLGDAPIPQLIVSPRSPMNPTRINTPVPTALLAAGDHNGSTFYQHQRFQAAVLGRLSPEVSLQDGIWAVRIGQAAQKSALEKKVIEL